MSRRKMSTLFLLFGSLFLQGQNSLQDEIDSRLIDLHYVSDGDENYEGFERFKTEIGDAQIVMLGEQSHTDATAFETKVKLIKYLHQEMDFEIVAFESNIYESDKAWSLVNEGHDVKDALAKSMSGIWSTNYELFPLFEYIGQNLKNEKPLVLTGFDPQFMGKIAVDYFIEDLRSHLSIYENIPLFETEIQGLESYINSMSSKAKASKLEARQNIDFLQNLRTLIQKEKGNEASEFWIQYLQSFEIFISDNYFGTDDRDEQMAKNLIWIKEKYPDKKIVCWGATSHFLYNSEAIKIESKRMKRAFGDYYLTHDMMGDYIKDEYGDDVYTIGFVAHQGYFGFNRNIKIKLPAENSLEYLIGKSEKDNYFLPLNGLSLEGYTSRPLAHKNITNDIAHIMDGVVFNRHMRRPFTDWDFLLYMYPENKMKAEKAEKLKHNTKISMQKLKEKRLKRDQINGSTSLGS